MARNTRKNIEKPITAAQIKRIHTIVSILQISDGTYRAALESRFNVASCKDLTLNQAQSFIRELDEAALQVQESAQRAELHKRMEESRQSWNLPYSDLDNRPGMASGAQLRKIEVMWSEVSIVPEPEARSRALRRFVFRIAQVADMRFLDLEGAGKVITALEAMKRNGTPQDRHVAK